MVDSDAMRNRGRNDPTRHAKPDTAGDRTGRNTGYETDGILNTKFNFRERDNCDFI